MSKIGFFPFLGRGHLYPSAALGRRLRSRGHDVTFFHLMIAKAAVLSAGLKFAPIDSQSSPSENARGWVDGANQLDTIDTVHVHAEQVLREAAEVVVSSGMEALVVDQMDLAAGSVADFLRLPFASLSCAPPLYLDDEVPPIYFNWPHLPSARARARNRMGNALISRLVSPTLELINRQRQCWSLPPFRHLNEVFSKTAIVTQVPAMLDFSRSIPIPQLVYAGPFRDAHIDREIPFPWARLTGKPLIYASLGTIRNNLPDVFRTIAEACTGIGAQLVLSLGGGRLLPEHLGPMPGDPVVVHFAPQRELMRLATLTVNCGGLNTTLDALLCGVPIVAIPIAEDQPGVAARIERAGVGISIPLKRLTVDRLREAVCKILEGSSHRDAAQRMQSYLNAMDGVGRAASAIEQSLGCPL